MFKRCLFLIISILVITSCFNESYSINELNDSINNRDYDLALKIANNLYKNSNNKKEASIVK